MTRVLRILKLTILYLFIYSIVIVILFRFIPPPVTPLMLIRVGEQIFSGQNVRMKKDWESLDNISRFMPKAVIASEDQLFMKHNGFDIKSIKKAMQNNNKKGHKKVKGASTISQQVAKNVFLWPGRSWLRKGLEAYFTVLIELFWSKKRIIEVYVNVAEMGNGIYGAEAAALHYFNKPAQNLSQSQCAALAAILPNPRKWSPVNSTNYINRRKSWIRRNMARLPNPTF
ncbi:MAG TPA: monofunctional biosynthetic peptidoglycan transglycosylase [Cytophagaceae bacterium]